MDPITIGLLAGGGLLGFLKSKANNKEADRRDRLNAALQANATKFQAFGHGDANGVMPSMEKQSILGNTLGGAFAGGMQGQNIASSMAKDNAYKKMLERINTANIA